MKILVLESLGLHLGFLGCYGNEWVGTPNLDRLAAEGIVFDNHFLDETAPSFLPTRAARTGHHAGNTANIDLPRILPEAGLTWRAYRWEKPAHFAGKAIREWDAISGDGICWIEGPTLAPPWHLPKDMLGAYLDDEAEDGPWPDPPQGVVPDDFDLHRCQDTYAAVITHFDEQIGRILEHLRERGEEDETMIVLTACAGLPLGERDVVGLEPPLLNEEALHVPMIWRLPHGKEAGLRVAALTQPVDLPASLVESLGLTIPASHGHSLWPLVRNEIHAVRPYAIALTKTEGAESWLLRTPEWAYIQDSAEQCQLYVKPEDRWEANDVHQHHPGVIEEFAKLLPGVRDAVQKPGPIVYPSLEGLND